MIHCNTCNT